jgi:hypothetical protein
LFLMQKIFFALKTITSQPIVNLDGSFSNFLALILCLSFQSCGKFISIFLPQNFSKYLSRIKLARREKSTHSKNCFI